MITAEPLPDKMGLVVGTAEVHGFASPRKVLGEREVQRVECVGTPAPQGLLRSSCGEPEVVYFIGAPVLSCTIMFLSPKPVIHRTY